MIPIPSPDQPAILLCRLSDHEQRANEGHRTEFTFAHGDSLQAGRCRAISPRKSPRLLQYVGASRLTSETMTSPQSLAVASRSPVGPQMAVYIQLRSGAS